MSAILLTLCETLAAHNCEGTEQLHKIEFKCYNKIIKAGVKNFEPLIITTNALIILRSSHQLQLQHLK